MPELPEVETVCRGIAPFCEGQTVHKVILRRPDLRFPFPECFEERIGGLKVTRVYRQAKYIICTFDSGAEMVVHLGMSGQVKMIHDLSSYEFIKHDHLCIALNNGGALVLNDTRRFGYVCLFDDQAQRLSDKGFASIGPDPFDAHFNAVALYKRLKKKNTIIKTALLDQRVIAGLGNIYVCEALFMAHIRPTRQASSLTKKECALLYDSIIKVLEKAIALGGSTLKDYRHADGKLGYFQNELLVYGREGLPCSQCAASDIIRIVQAGRSTFYCPSCQR